MSRKRLLRRACSRAALSLSLGGFLLLTVGLVGAPLPPIADPEVLFLNPPSAARPRVLWMWMGSNVTREGITRDLEALRDAGFGGATLFSLADVCTPWAAKIQREPTPEIVAFSEPWWKLIRFAAEEAHRLGLDFGIHNCAGYESSGGTWITPELSMQELVWSETPVPGGGFVSIPLLQLQADVRAHQPYPVVDPTTGKAEKPISPGRKDYYRDVAVLALPASGVAAKENVIDLTNRLSRDGQLQTDLPAGNWIIYRFGRTTQGKFIQPSQWEALGLECDKMNADAVAFHIGHVISEAKKYLGPEFGRGFTHLHFDSYESGEPNWTLKMAQEFRARRGYDLTPWLPVMAGRVVENNEAAEKFRADFKQTIRDLYRDMYYPTLQKEIHASGLELCSEPYGGPWDISQVVPRLDRVMTEFWTNDGKYSPFEVEPVLAGVKAAHRTIVDAEAFTGAPAVSEWTETPSWLKAIGDAAFTHGINRMVLHHFVHQPWSDALQPGMAMGQWGTHFGRYQTWWEPGKAWITYLARCQALLQWGERVVDTLNDFTASPNADASIQALHRRAGQTDLYFVANTSRDPRTVLCSFAVTGKTPELWDPVHGTRRALPEYAQSAAETDVPLDLAPAESCFVVFRNKVPAGKDEHSEAVGKAVSNFPRFQTLHTLDGEWTVKFDPRWGGPKEGVVFTSLQDWTTRPEVGVRFFSGTAVYTKSFDCPNNAAGAAAALDLGTVLHLARAVLNGRDLGVVWTAPWRVEIPSGVLRGTGNTLRIEVTNVWANRLIGDEQEPPDCLWSPGFMGHGGYLTEFPDWFLQHATRPSPRRLTFTTWNYFTKDSPLVPSGLLGPVRLVREE